MIAQTIQLALAPVFVLVAISNILNLLSTRLGRVVDRSRDLQGLHMATEGLEHDMVVQEFRLLDRRIGLITAAIRLLVLSGLAIGTTVAVLFLEDFAGFRLQLLAAAFFLVAIALLMWALVLLLRETRVAARQLRVPHEFLEPDRDL